MVTEPRRSVSMNPYVAVTDRSWFDYLASESGGVADEVNFWSPRSTRPLRHMDPGEPVFFRFGRGVEKIGGYAFFAHFSVLDLDLAWELFEWKNGDPSRLRFLERIGQYRRVNLFAQDAERAPLGCTILRHAVFWPETDWISWGSEMGWSPNVVRGKTESDAERIALLAQLIAADTPDEFEAGDFKPLDVDERQVVAATHAIREGQGAFRTRLFDAYERRCCVTGEHTEPVLDAAHIQPYLGPRSNHLQNGLVLTKEFHALFDRGYVTVTPDYRVRVSPRLRADWKNGHRYYPYDGQPLLQLPNSPWRPSPAVLAWHNERIFRRAA